MRLSIAALVEEIKTVALKINEVDYRDLIECELNWWVWGGLKTDVFQDRLQYPAQAQSRELSSA